MSLHEETLLQDEQQRDAAQCCIRPECLLHSCERGMHRRSVSARSLMCECYHVLLPSPAAPSACMNIAYLSN